MCVCFGLFFIFFLPFFSSSGITVASPTDVVKVRLQAEGRLPEGTPRRYNGAIDAYKKIVQQEGVIGLWTGYGPNLARNCVVNATELVAYDQVSKQSLRKNTVSSLPLCMLTVCTLLLLFLFRLNKLT